MSANGNLAVVAQYYYYVDDLYSVRCNIASKIPQDDAGEFIDLHSVMLKHTIRIVVLKYIKEEEAYETQLLHKTFRR